MSRSNKLGYVIAIAILIIALLVAATIAAGVYSNGFESVKARYVTVNGKVPKTGVSLPLDKDTVFTLKGAGFKAANWGEYTVEVKGNPAYCTSFTYKGKTYEYANLDLTEYFDFQSDGNVITLAQGDYSIRTILAEYAGGVVNVKPKAGEAAYVMTVTGENGKAVIYLDCVIEATDIELNPPEIIAG